MFSNPYHSACITAWVFLLLIGKNLGWVFYLAVLRTEGKQFKIPEDRDFMGAGSGSESEGSAGANLQAQDEWSPPARVNKILGNEAEYTPYFLILFMLTWQLSSAFDMNNSSERLISYGLIYVFARYLHNFSYYFKYSVGRLAGFFITLFVLAAMVLDMVILATKHVNDSFP